VHSLLNIKPRRGLWSLLGATAFGLIAAGCHNHNLDSGFGVAWTSLTAPPQSQFTSYIVNIDSVVVNGKLNGAIGAIAIPETVDLTKLGNVSELWSTASVPVDTFTSVTVTVDYTNAEIAVMVNGVPVKATIVDPTGATPTTVTFTVAFDPANPLTLPPTFATTAAQRMAFSFDIDGSSTVNMATSPPTVTVNPFMAVSISAADTKLIRVRGPLVNSSVNAGTYSTVVRPFFDEVNSLGTLTIFNTPQTIYTLNGTTFVGAPGLQALTLTSAGSTMTAAYCTFTPTATLNAGVSAGIFNSKYVIAGSTLEDFYTFGLEGDVIARSGNTLTLRGSTLFANAAQLVQYQILDSIVLLGPSTIVTVDGSASFPGLTSNSISVGQHIIARGISTVSTAGVVTIDATGSSATNTGSVRLVSTEAFGTLVSSAAGSLVLNLENIEEWPASVFNFAGNGTSSAQDPTPANYVVATGSLALPLGASGAAVAPGDPLWIDGFSSPFGTAPPAFMAQSINAEPSVPATLLVSWTGTGTAAPFATFTTSGLSIDLANAEFASGQIRIGAETLDITTLGGSPQVVPQVAAAPLGAGLVPVFMPLFSVGNPTIGISSFNVYSTFVTQVNTTFATPTPATRFTAVGLYNRATNTFSASTINVVL
jgi:hypothetical protein